MAAVVHAEPVPATQAVASVEVPSAATLPLDEIMPRAVLPAPRKASTAPATEPTTSPAKGDRPPIEAVLLYGRAVDELHANRRLAAVDLLEKAAALDPESFEVHYALGKAYTREGATPDPRSIASLERAAAINPDHLRLQVELARMLLATGDEEQSLWHLRLALKTTAYATDPAGAAMAELLLIRGLSRKGYHAAALELYERLSARLENPGGALRSNPEIAFLIARPELLRLQAAESYEQTGRFDKALAAYESAAQKDPGSFEIRARVVRALVALKRYDEAAAQAADVVARFRASAPSLALLKEVTSADGRGGSPVQQLQRLVAQKPNERSLRFALADVLRGDGKGDEARAVLRSAGEKSPGDPEVVRRLYELERDGSPDGAPAARFLIDWSARFPDSVHLLGEHWDDLLRGSAAKRFGLRELRELIPPSPGTPGEGGGEGASSEISDLKSQIKSGRPSPQPSPGVPGEGAKARGNDASTRWEAARQFWVAHVARLRHRRDVAREALHRSAAGRPRFEPAMRALAGWDLDELGMSADERDSAVAQLAAAAERDGDVAIAEEVRGVARLGARDFAGAGLHLARAVEISGASPERQFALAVAERGAGDEAAFERMMWKLVSDWPGFEDAFEALASLYEARDADSASAKVLSTWLAADPGSVAARLAQVREQIRVSRIAAAQALVQRLFAEKPGDPRVLATLVALYGQGERSGAWLVTELQQRHTVAPGDLMAAAQLANLLADDGRGAEAARVLDATRAALARDADLLYEVAHLYERVGQKATTERVLREVLTLEPAHAPAANDLGYSLAEEGRELARAEALVRAAVAREPANGSFLDSLGWVLYKRGKLAEAREYLQRAVESAGAASGAEGEEAGGADPVVLDHLGDAVYRQGDVAAAGKQWERAAQKLAQMPAGRRDRDDLKQLRLQLERKRKQLEAGQPVSTAPVVENAGGATGAGRGREGNGQSEGGSGSTQRGEK